MTFPNDRAALRLNVIATWGTCTTRWPMTRRHLRTYVVSTLTVQWSRSEETTITHTHTFSTDESRLHQFGKESVPWNVHGLCLSCGGRLVSWLTHRRSRRLGKPVYLRSPRRKIQPPRGLTWRNPIISLCKRYSQTVRSSSLPPWWMPRWKNLLLNGGRKRKKQSWKKKTEKISGAWVEASFAVTTKNSDQLNIVRPTRTNNSFSMWSTSKWWSKREQAQTTPWSTRWTITGMEKVTLHCLRNGMERRDSQIGRSSTQKDTHGKMVYPQKFRHTHDPTRSGSRNGEDDQRKKTQTGMKKKAQIARISPKILLFGVSPEENTTSRWSQKLEQNSSNALCPQGWMVGETCGCADVLLPQEARCYVVQQLLRTRRTSASKTYASYRREKICIWVPQGSGTQDHLHQGSAAHSRTQSGTRMGQLQELANLGRDASKATSGTDSTREKWRKTRFVRICSGSLPLEACGICETSPDVQQQCCALTYKEKNDNEHRAAFTQQSATDSQASSGKILDTSLWLSRTARQTNDHNNACRDLLACWAYKTRMPTSMDKTITQSKTETLGHHWRINVSFKKYLYGHPFARITLGKKIGRCTIVLVYMWTPSKIGWDGKKGTSVDKSRKRRRSGRCNPWLSQVFLGCTQREAEVPLEAA